MLVEVESEKKKQLVKKIGRDHPETASKPEKLEVKKAPG